jgi:hypothetical protein
MVRGVNKAQLEPITKLSCGMPRCSKCMIKLSGRPVFHDAIYADDRVGNRHALPANTPFGICSSPWRCPVPSSILYTLWSLSAIVLSSVTQATTEIFTIHIGIRR